MIDHERRHRQAAHGLERAQPAHVADVEHDHAVDLRERGGALGGAVAHVVTLEEREALRPRGGIHDVRGDSHLVEQSRERRLRAAPIAVGIDVGRQRDRLVRSELRREPVDVGAPLHRNADRISGRSSLHAFSGRKRQRRPESSGRRCNIPGRYRLRSAAIAAQASPPLAF